MSKKTMFRSVAIIGVGLIGGSIGLAVRKRRLAAKVIGIGRRASGLRKARQRGAVDATTTNLVRGVADTDLVVVCTPVEQVVEYVVQAARHARHDTLLTDVGSTKEMIVRDLQRQLAGRGRFVGSHPLAGSEKAGVEYAESDLFVNRTVVVTPADSTCGEDVEQITRFWQALGSTVVIQSPQQHDRALAATSHLPHLIASALAAATDPDDLPLAATGWSDTTRIAAGDAELWRQILIDNRQHLLEALARFDEMVAGFRKALETNDSRKLLRLLETGKQRRDSVAN